MKGPYKIEKVLDAKGVTGSRKSNKGRHYNDQM